MFYFPVCWTRKMGRELVFPFGIWIPSDYVGMVREIETHWGRLFVFLRVQ